MISFKTINPMKKVCKHLPVKSYSNKEGNDKPIFLVDELKNSIASKNKEETRKIKQLLKKRENYLEEASINFYELEIKIELYYQHNSYQSMYVKSLLDFSNVNFTGVK